MLHQRQRLALSVESGDYLLRVHPQLDDLQGDSPFHRLLLLGHIHHPETTLADFLQEPVMTDRIPGLFRDWLDNNSGGLVPWTLGRRLRHSLRPKWRKSRTFRDGT